MVVVVVVMVVVVVVVVLVPLQVVVFYSFCCRDFLLHKNTQKIINNLLMDPLSFLIKNQRRIDSVVPSSNVT